MNKVWTGLIATAIAAPAFGQATAVLYTPTRSINDQSISIRPWGSGTVSETDEVAYEGTHSIRVSTRNLFQGGMISFGKPEDLSRAFMDKGNLLRVVYRLASDGGTRTGGYPGMGGGAPMGGPGRGGVPGGGAAGRGGVRGGGPAGGRGGGIQGGPPGGFPGGPGGFPGGPGGFPGGPGGYPGMGGASNQTANTLKTLRLIVTTSDGLKSEVYLPTTTSAAPASGWRSISVPLQAIAGLDRTNKIVKDIAVAGDATTTLYVGDVRIVNDTTPISGSARAVRLATNGTYVDVTNVGRGDEVLFNASGTGGASVLTYSWDFDASDGIQVDAEGATVKRRFRVPGTFVITLTITDQHGLKAPYSTKVNLTVNQ